MIDQLKTKLESCFNHFLDIINQIHGATLNTGFIDSIKVNNVPISELGFTSKSGNYIDIQVYDPTMVGVITSTIQKQGHSVYASKNVVRVSIPIASLETRTKNQKRVMELAEEAKVACRKVRQAIRTKAMKEAKSEDEKETLDKEIQKALDASIDQIDFCAKKKCENL